MKQGWFIGYKMRYSRLKYIFLALIVLIFILLAYVLLSNSDANSYKLAKEALANKDYEIARQRFRASKSESPTIRDYSDYYYAQTYLLQENYQESFKLFSDFSKTYPDSAIFNKAKYGMLFSKYKFLGKENMTNEEVLDFAILSYRENERQRTGYLLYWLLSNRAIEELDMDEVLVWLTRYEVNTGVNPKKYSLLLAQSDSKYADVALFLLKKHDELIERFPQSYLTDDVLYDRGIALYRDNKLLEAEKEFQKIVRQAPPTADYKPGAMFWLYKIYNIFNKPQYANIHLNNLAKMYPHSYFGIRANQILGNKIPKFVIESVSEKYLYLSEIGCLDDATLEIREKLINDRDNTFYILPFWDKIQEVARQAGIDPYLVIALIREESRYQPKIDSRVGAMGLMQLMPGTARGVAKTLKIPIENIEDVYTPSLNITLGTNYLKYLKNNFFEDDISILAGYNAGPNAIRSWRNRFSDVDDPDDFIEKITYKETRSYVKKVLRSYWLYKTLEDE